MDFAATISRGRSDDDRWQHAIFVVDQSNQITDANHAAQLLTAKSKVDLIGTQITQWLDLGDDHSRAEVQPGQHQGHSFDAAKSVILRNSDGETQAIHLTLSRFPVGESGLTIFVASERSDPDQMPEHARLDNHASTDGNAAGQVPTEQQVIEQERLRVAGILATGMAHDIANILSPAIVFADLVVDQGDLSSPQSQQLKRIQRCVEDIGAIVDRFKRLGQPPAVPRYSQVVLSDFLQSVAELTQPRWKSDASRNGKSVHLQWHATDQLRVEIDESAMRSVLTNLVFNAVDAIPQQGQIEMRAEAAGDHAVISVADDGQGMTNDQVTRCLEPFVTFRPNGCGIGLTMCQQIVAQHNGQIEIASKPGRGTEVKITLPLTCPPRSDVPKSTDGHQGRRVLLVDDDESVRESICALLAVKGLKTDAVADRDQAIARLETSQYDVVISDLTLKNMRGDQLLQECRQRWPQVRRVLISGWSDEAKDDVSSGSDAEMRLAKPFNADDLLQRLAKLDDQVG